MRDPYQVLGVSRRASEDEIKKAYKNMSRRFHPDANVNNPYKGQAEEKFKEIQSAYQQIMKERTEGYSYGQGGYGQSYGQGGYGYGGSSYGGGTRQDENPFGGFGGSGGFGGFYGGFGQGRNTGYEDEPHVRAAGNYIRNGYYQEARNALDGMAQQYRSARWYYYSAIANSGLGNNVAALEHARRAAALEPENEDYHNLIRQFESGGAWYTQRQAAYGFPTVGRGDICMKICIANMVCSLCCGGSGIGMCCGGNRF